MFDKGFAAGPDAAASDEPAAGPVDAPGRVEAMLSALQHLGHVGVWDLDIATGTMWWSDGLYTIHGYPPDSFPASLDRLVANTHPGDRAAFTEQLHALITNGRELDVISRVVRPDSSPRYVHRRGSLLRDSDGNPLRVCATSIDVTDTRVLESERDEALVRLFASEARYRMLAENAWDVIWTMSLDGTVTYVSPSVQRVRGITPEEAAPQTLDQIHPAESVARVTAYYEALFAAIQAETELPTFRGEQQYYRKDGSIMTGELEVKPQLDADGRVVQILGVTRDVSERKRLESELQRLALTDDLTGAYNRRYANEILPMAIKKFHRYRTPASVLLIDIDHFKAINDRCGHLVGDAVLTEFARRIAEVVRESDTLVRWGGEEFLLLAERCSMTQAVVVAEKLQAAFAHPVHDAGEVTVSIGVAEINAGDDLDSWIHRADDAMYAAKAAGRDSIQVSE